MGLVLVREIGDRSAAVELSGREYTRRHVRAFVVQFDSPDDGPERAKNAAGIPTIGDALDDSPYLTVRSVVPDSLGGDPMLFLVRVEYEARATLGENGEIIENPLDAPTEQEIEFDERLAPFVFDARDGRPVQNSAEQDFDPPLEVSEYGACLTISKNEANFNLARARRMIGRYNVSTFFGQPPDTVKLIRLNARREGSAGRLYWKHTYTFRFSQDGTTQERRVLDQGTRYLEQGQESNGYVVAVDDAGNPLGQVPLDGLGHRLPSGNSPVYLTYWDGKQADFGELHLEDGP